MNLNYLVREESHTSKFQTIFILMLLSLSASILIVKSVPENFNNLILVLGPLIFLFLLKKGTNSIITFFILVCYVNYFIYWYELPRFLTWYIELYALALFMSVIGYIALNKKDVPSFLKLFLILLSVILINHLISFYLNNQSFLQFLMASRKYYVYLALFLAIVILPGEKEFYERFIKIIIFTIFIQIPISIFQYFIFESGDFMGGLFGKNSAGTISTLGVGFGFFGYYLYKYYKRKKMFLFSGVGMIIPLVLGESKFGMILLPMAYIFNLIVEKKHYFRKIFVFVCFIPVYILTLLIFDYINAHNSNYTPYMHRTLENPFYLLSHYSDKEWTENIEAQPDESGYVPAAMGRVASLRFAFNYIRGSFRTLLFGYGPGEASQDLYLPGSLVNLGFYRSFLVISLLEWGIIGTGAWLLIFLYLFIINLKCLRYFQKKTRSSLWKAFCYFSNMQMFIFLFEFIYSQSFIEEYKGLFFCLTNGLIVWYYKNFIKDEQTLLKSKVRFNYRIPLIS